MLLFLLKFKSLETNKLEKIIYHSKYEQAGVTNYDFVLFIMGGNKNRI